MTRRRVVITGIEVIAPGGVGKEKFWNLLSEGRTATRGITFFDPAPFRSRVAAEIDFDPYAHGLTAQEVRRLDRAAQFAVVASRGAVADSGIDLGGIDPHRIGVTVGSAVGATMSLDEEYRVVSDGGRLDLVDHAYAVPHLYDHMVPSSFASEVAWAVGAEGPSTVVSTGCTSGLDSVGYAVELVREGSADVVIAGSSDAPISPITMACFDAIKATTPATTIRRAPRAPSTAPATGSCWARAPPSSCWRSWRAPRSAARTSTPRSPAMRRAPTRTT